VAAVPILGDKRVRATAQTDGGPRARHSHLESCRHAPAARCASHFIHPPPVFGARAAVAGAGAHGACHPKYLYNKPGDNVRVCGTTPPKTLRGLKSIERLTRRGERGEREELFSFYERARGDHRL